jgi:acyl carrier protein
MSDLPKDRVARASFIVGKVYGGLHPEAPMLQLTDKLSNLMEDSLDFLEYFMELENEIPTATFTDNEIVAMKDLNVSQLIDRVAAKMS